MFIFCVRIDEGTDGADFFGDDFFGDDFFCWFTSGVGLKQDHLRVNVAPDQTIILGLRIFLDHRSLSSIGRKILMILPPSKIPCCVLSYFLLVFVG